MQPQATASITQLVSQLKEHLLYKFDKFRENLSALCGLRFVDAASKAKVKPKRKKAGGDECDNSQRTSASDDTNEATSASSSSASSAFASVCDQEAAKKTAKNELFVNESATNIDQQRDGEAGHGRNDVDVPRPLLHHHADGVKAVVNCPVTKAESDISHGDERQNVVRKNVTSTSVSSVSDDQKDFSFSCALSPAGVQLTAKSIKLLAISTPDGFKLAADRNALLIRGVFAENDEFVVVADKANACAKIAQRIIDAKTGIPNYGHTELLVHASYVSDIQFVDRYLIVLATFPNKLLFVDTSGKVQQKMTFALDDANALHSRIAAPLIAVVSPSSMFVVLRDQNIVHELEHVRDSNEIHSAISQCVALYLSSSPRRSRFRIRRFRREVLMRIREIGCSCLRQAT